LTRSSGGYDRSTTWQFRTKARRRPLLDVGTLKVDADVTGPVADVRLVGELDLRTADALLDLVDGLLDQDLGAIRLDGTGLTFVDSAGLRVIVLGLVRATDAGITYEISDASESLERVLSITGLAEVLGR
jgi:anti-sigma B factor antagonist